MKQVKWGIENEALLKRLRVNAGIDIATLARKTILSTTQLRQLEEGGESAFYSAEIKYSIGKKVLKHLGHELVSDFSTANPGAEINRNEKSANEMTFPLAGHEQAKFEPPLNFKFFGMGRFVLTVFITGLIFILLWLVTSWPDNLPQEKLATDVSAATHTKPVVTPLLQSADEVVQKVNAEETQKEVATSSQDPCPWQPIELEITPDAPRKKADFVYLVSVKAVTLCMDIGGQQINTLSLSAGEGRSIYGKGPFKIYSTDLATLQIFFQGQLIKLPSSDIRQVKLSAAPIQ